MIDASEVRSGYDVEVLLGADYIRQILLSSVDTGDFPTSFQFALSGSTLNLTIHPPTDFKRRYQPLAVKLPSPVAGSFDVDIAFDDSFGADVTLRLICDINILLGASTTPATYNQVGLVLRIAFAMQEVLNTRDEIVGATANGMDPSHF